LELENEDNYVPIAVMKLLEGMLEKILKKDWQYPKFWINQLWNELT